MTLENFKSEPNNIYFSYTSPVRRTFFIFTDTIDIKNDK